MRLKGFFITTIIFTVFYILFFFVFDKIVLANEQKRNKKRIDSILDESRFSLFAQFYGLNTVVPRNILERIFNEVPRMPSISISSCSSNYQITPYEFIVAVVYLEYYHLMELKEVYFDGNVMIPVRQNNLSLILKYQPFFVKKTVYNDIVENIGQSAIREMDSLNQLYLIPGVRIINSQIYYYVGDINENK